MKRILINGLGWVLALGVFGLVGAGLIHMYLDLGVKALLLIGGLCVVIPAVLHGISWLLDYKEKDCNVKTTECCRNTGERVVKTFKLEDKGRGE